MGVIEPEQGVGALQQVMAQGEVQVAVLPIHWPKILRNLGDQVPPLLSRFVQQTAADTTAAKDHDFLATLQASAAGEQRALLIGHVQEQVMKVLGLPGQPGLEQGLIEMGMDSLMAVELSNRLQGSLRQSFPSTLAFEHPTVAALVDYLTPMILSQTDAAAGNGVAGEGGREDAAQLLTKLDDLSDQQVDTLLAQLLSEQEKPE
jgi:acyl carrier protein